ncbi:TPA: hypothetical protein PXN49_004130 [Yersinia enterocolitica]|nr:hypothetical protein [Yersinia enterocolitica]
MSTHIKTTNALKGLTCAASSLIPLAVLDGIHATALRTHVRKHLVAAGTEIDRLNSETIKLRSEIEKLKASDKKPIPQASIFKRWKLIIDAVSTTTAGLYMLPAGADVDADTATEKAVAAINRTEADRKEALRTAEAFQKAQPKAVQARGVYLGWPNHHPFDALNYLSLSRNWIQGFDQRVRYESISTEIVDEAMRASEIHPKWPTDALHAVSILTEESGELMKAAIEYHYNNGDIEAVREEAVQTGAMALRVLMNIDKYNRPSDQK